MLNHDSSDIENPPNSLVPEALPCSFTDGPSDVSAEFHNKANPGHCEISSTMPTPGPFCDTEPHNQIIADESFFSTEMPADSSSQTHDLDVCRQSVIATQSDYLPSMLHVQENEALTASCDSPCCTQGFPCHPTPDKLKKTSVKQPRTDGQADQFRQCPFSVFSKFPWTTYCLTRGTIACFHCKKAMERNLITLSNHTKKAFSLGEFCNWKKCHDKLEKHQNSHCHQEAVEKRAHLVDEKNDIGAQLDNQHRSEQDLHRRISLKQLNSLKYLARQGLPLRGHESLNSNLIQMLKTSSEDVSELND